MRVIINAKNGADERMKGQYIDSGLKKELTVSILIIAAATISGLFISLLCGGIILMAGCLISAAHYYFSRKRYREIEALSDSIDRILYGQDEVMISDSCEGELAVLNSEIHKMTLKLKEQTDQLSQDKIRLTKAIEDIFHQLRTPLTTMNLVVTLLTKEELDYDKRISHTRLLKTQLERMQWMVETLLKMSKIDAGTVSFHREICTAADLLRKASNSLLVPMELRDQTYIVKAENASLLCDENWTAEALANLIKNCMEHTPAGGTISVFAEETALSTDITIQDDGEGFIEEDIPYLFERFYKGKNASKDSIGIGLAFSRMVIAEQNGTITASNLPSGGACFKVKFFKSVI